MAVVELASRRRLLPPPDSVAGSIVGIGARYPHPMSRKYLLLGSDGSQRWELPDNADLKRIRKNVSDAMATGSVMHVVVHHGGTPTLLILNGANLVAVALVEDPSEE